MHLAEILRPPNRITILATALVCGAGVQLYTIPEVVTRVSQPINLPAPERDEHTFKPRQPKPYKLIGQRPLFTEGRRPWIDSAQSVSEPPIDPGKPPSLKTTVAGTITTPEQKIAFVRDKVSGDVLTLEEGEVFSNEDTQWRVHQVSERVVSFLSQAPQAPSKVNLAVGGSSEPVPD